MTFESDMRKMQWFDCVNHSTLANSGVWGSSVGLYLNADSTWTSNTPPIFGTWATKEEGKAAIETALRKGYASLLEQLDQLKSVTI